jgi:hypothetical protein
MIGGSANVGRWRHLIARPLGNRAVNDDVTCLDHRLRMRTRPGQAAPHQLPIEALSHSSAGRSAAGRAVIFSIQRLLQVFVSFREPIMMLGKRRGREVCEPEQRIVDRIVASVWRGDWRVRILDLGVVALGHFSPEEMLSAVLAVLRGGFRPADLVAAAFLVEVAAAAFFAGALFAGAFFAAALFADAFCAAVLFADAFCAAVLFAGAVSSAAALASYILASFAARASSS